MAEEYLDVLDDKGVKTGQSLTYKEVHAKGLIHRTARVWFINSKNELLVQKRSLNKKVYPGLWDAGVGGHISSGESSIEGAQKETREEIGLDLPAGEYELIFSIRAPVYKYFEDFIDNEFNDVYIVKKDLDISKLKIEKDEVEELRWIDLDTFTTWINKEPKIFAEHPEEYQKLITYLKNN